MSGEDNPYDVIQGGVEKAIIDPGNLSDPDVLPKQLIWNLLTIAYSDEKYRIDVKEKKHKALIGKGVIEGQKVILIQAATNMFNEYYDYKRGLDNEESVGIGGTIVRHGVAPKTIMIIALSFYAIAMLLGLYICKLKNFVINDVFDCCEVVL